MIHSMPPSHTPISRGVVASIVVLAVFADFTSARATPPAPPPHPPPRVAAGPFGIGDPQPFGRILSSGDLEWHVFFLRSLQSGTWDHLVSKDLLRWEVWYNAVGPAHQGDSQYNLSFPWAQLSAYTGSVMEGSDGLYHAFYTAYGGGNGVGRESIVHATSPDLYNFTLIEDNSTVVSPDGSLYFNGTARDFRDSFVFAVPPGGYKRDPSIKYLMAVAADARGTGEAHHTAPVELEDPTTEGVELDVWHEWRAVGNRARLVGAPVPPTCKLPNCVTGLAGSADLYHWKVLPPIQVANGSEAVAPTECPDIFQLPNDPHWYLISGGYNQPALACDTVRVSKDGIDGTFSLAPYPCIDRYIYAAKRMRAGNRTVAVAWVPGQPYGSECGYSWGGAFMTPRELWSNVTELPGQIFSTLPPEYLAHYGNFTSVVGPLRSGKAVLHLPDSYAGHDPYLPNISCPWDNYAIVEVNATLESGGSFNLTLLPEPIPPNFNNKTYMYWGYNLTVSAKHIGFEGNCESHDWDIPTDLTGPVNVKCMVSQDLLECFVADRYAMTIRGQVNTGNRTATVAITSPPGTVTITSAAVRTEFLSNRRCMLPLQGAPVPMNGQPVPWPRGCVGYCEQLCSRTPGCVGFTLHADKAPNMASCGLKNCTTDFALAEGWEYFAKNAEGGFVPSGALAPPQQLPGFPPVKDPTQCSVPFPNNGSAMPPALCPIRYACHGDCRQDPTGIHTEPDCNGECLAPPPPPPPAPPRAFCNTTNSTNECPGGMVCPSCPRKPCVCPPWPPVAPWVVTPACLDACQRICDNATNCAGVLFSRVQVDGQQCSFANCSNVTSAPHDGNQWLAFAKNTSGYTEHYWSTFSCPRAAPVLVPYNCETGAGGTPPPPPPPPPPPLVNCTQAQLESPRHSSLWMPSVPNATADSWSGYLTEHRSSYDTLSQTWAFWNSKYNSKCNATAVGRNLGLCGRMWSPDGRVVTATASHLKMRVVPILEVCCVCVLNSTNNNYTEAMGLLVQDAVDNNFNGYVLDMICGGWYEKERAAFLSEFKAQLVAALPASAEPQVSWFSHGFYNPQGSFPNNADYLFDMDTYSHPNYAPAWVGSFSCQAGIGLEWPGSGTPDQMAAIFVLLANMTNLRAVGTWGAVPNGTDAMNAAWFLGLSTFLST